MGVARAVVDLSLADNIVCCVTSLQDVESPTHVTLRELE